MISKKINLRFVAAIALTGLLLGGTAHAIPVFGSIDFNGEWTPIDSGGNATSIVNATGISFGGAAVNMFPAPTGDFAGTGGTPVSFTDFQFNPFPAGGVLPLWEFTFNGTTFAFDLLNTTVTQQEPNNLDLAASGMMQVDGRDPTPYVWQFAGLTTDQARFSFTAQNTTATVPEPGTLALLGIALLAIMLLRRRLRPENLATATRP